MSPITDNTVSDFHRETARELRHLEQEIAGTQRRIASLGAVLKNLEELYDFLPSYSSGGDEGDRRRGQAAIERILVDAAGKWLAVKEITAELEVRGWVNPGSSAPEAATRIALRRLDHRESGIEKKTEGRSVRYRSKPPENEEAVDIED